MQSCDMSYLQHNVGRRNYFVFLHINPLLIGLLQVDYQSKKKSPFETHAPNIRLCLLFICLGLSTKTELQNFHRRNNTQIIIGYITLSSRVLSSIALASIFLPQWLGWLWLGSWTILPIMLARHFVNQKKLRIAQTFDCENNFACTWKIQQIPGMSQVQEAESARVMKFYEKQN
ncbi:hypothetical protein Ddye_018125 [Dipteronia dyeriana]|uniref:Uncharacterized protein n=1 Tax=Dipteronia dyeriana TaxID=168575 RepID=A0AAD9U9Z4_9ROSI|nr:hypothetical protein Ddye_018125 [Dipteronia dyeriana]